MENGHSIAILEKEKVNIETIKNDKIVKLPWVLKLGPKLRKEF